MNNKKKYIATSILVGSMAFSVGCSSSNNTDNNEEISKQSLSNNVDFMEDKNSIYGEIIAINEGNITLALGQFNMKGKGERPDGEMPNSENPSGERPEMPSNTDGERPEPPSHSDGEKPEMPEGEKPNGEQEPMNGESMEIISLTGEEKVVTITSDIKISKLNMKKPNSENENEKKDSYTNEQLTLDDLSLGDIIKVNYNKDNTKIESVELISVPSMENNKENTDKEEKESSKKENEDVAKG